MSVMLGSHGAAARLRYICGASMGIGANVDVRAGVYSQDAEIAASINGPGGCG